MIELARLYQEVAELVQQQEPAVEQINTGAHDVVENVDNANKQIDSAIVSARNARKWKWYILLAVSKYNVPIAHGLVSSRGWRLTCDQFSLSSSLSLSPLQSPRPTSTRSLSASLRQPMQDGRICFYKIYRRLSYGSFVLIPQLQSPVFA